MAMIKVENVWAGRRTDEKPTTEQIQWRDALFNEMKNNNILTDRAEFFDEAMVRAERMFNGKTLLSTTGMLSRDDVKNLQDKLSSLPKNEQESAKIFFTMMFYWYGWSKKGLPKITDAVKEYLGGAKLTDLSRKYLPRNYNLFFVKKYDELVKETEKNVPTVTAPAPQKPGEKGEKPKASGEIEETLTNLDDIINIFAKCEDNKDNIEWEYTRSTNILTAIIVTKTGFENYNIDLNNIDVKNADDAYTLAAELDMLGNEFPQLYNFSGFHEVGTEYTAKSAEDLDHIINFVDTALSKDLGNVDLNINEKTGEINIAIKIGKRTLTYNINDETVKNVGDVVGGPFCQGLCHVFFNNHPEWSEEERQAFLDRLHTTTLTLLSGKPQAPEHKPEKPSVEPEVSKTETETKATAQVINVKDKHNVLRAFDELEKMIKKEGQMSVLFSGGVLVISGNNKYLLDSETAKIISGDPELLDRFKAIIGSLDSVKDKDFANSMRTQLLNYDIVISNTVPEKQAPPVTTAVPTAATTAIACNTKSEINQALTNTVEFMDAHPDKFPLDFDTENNVIIITLGSTTYYLNPISANLITADGKLKELFDDLHDRILNSDVLNENDKGKWSEYLASFFNTPETLSAGPNPVQTSKPKENILKIFDKDMNVVANLNSAEYDEKRQELIITDNDGNTYVLTPDIAGDNLMALSSLYNYFLSRNDDKSKVAVGEFARIVE
ncbi:hypothetical protein J7J90_01440 [Candidatus Micrarchaeota archaeon]|nr:hypothetical protein [Candidatus Micrarchaeota archaeon]